MPIDLNPADILTLPAKTEAVLDKLWIRQILIQTPSPLHEGSVTLEYGPWSGDMTQDAVWRNENLEDISKRIQLNEMYATLALVPELNAAFDAILDAVKPIEAYLAAKKAAEEAAAAETANQNVP